MRQPQIESFSLKKPGRLDRRCGFCILWRMADGLDGRDGVFLSDVISLLTVKSLKSVVVPASLENSVNR